MKESEFKQLLHDIRNMKDINKYIISQFHTMSNEQKMDIIITLNISLQGLKSVLELE